MDYTGTVQRLGPSAVRPLVGMTIRKANVSEMDNNAYLLSCSRTGAQLLIDAADSPDRLVDLIAEGSPRGLATVVTTHSHADHWQALRTIVDRYRPRVAIGRDDALAVPVRADVLLDDGDELTVGDVRLTVVALRGHTPGSIALVYREPSGSAHIFTGDSLFPGGVGRTGSPADFARLYDDVVTRLFGQFPDDTWIYPGHGNDTTLGIERPHLAQWRARGW